MAIVIQSTSLNPPLIPGGGGGGGPVTVSGLPPIVVTGGPAYVVSFAIGGQAQGDLVYFDGANWTRLPAGTAGELLSTGGPGANPSWVSAGFVPTTRTVQGTEPVAIDGDFAAHDLSANRTWSFLFTGQARGDVVYRGAAAWARLPAGTAGQFLTTGGAGADPSWTSGVPSTRTVQGTAPVAIDGVFTPLDLSANRTWTLSIDASRMVVTANQLLPQLALNTALQGMDSGATLRDLLQIATTNVVTVGNTAAGSMNVLSAGTISYQTGGATTRYRMGSDGGLLVGNAIVGNALGAVGVALANNTYHYGSNALNNAYLQTIGIDASNRTALGNATAPWIQLGGRIRRRTATAVSYVALQSDDYIGVTDTSAPRTVTLPNAATAGTTYVVADESGNAGNSSLIVNTAGGTINGQSSIRIYDNYGTLTFTSDGTNWRTTAVHPGVSTSGMVLATDGVSGVQFQPTSILFDTWKGSVRAVATTNVASLSGTTTIDGVSLAAGDVVLLVAQSSGANNGKWTVQGGGWTRPTDYDTNPKLPLQHVVGVREGTNFANTMWRNTNTTAINLGVTSITFECTVGFNNIAQNDNGVLLAWRRNLTSGARWRAIWSDSAGNVTFGDTTAAATLVTGNNDIRLTTTASAGNSASNIGISNTLIIFNMASGISAIDTLQINNTPQIVIGQRDNTTAAVPVLVPIRGSEPASTQADTAPSGQEIGLGRGRGTGEGVGTLTAYQTLSTGTTLQSTKKTVASWRYNYFAYGSGRKRNLRTATGTTDTATIVDDEINCTNAAGCTVTLPAASAVPDGWELWLDGNNDTGVTADPAGSDTINNSVSNFTAGVYETIVITRVSSTNFLARKLSS